MSDTNRIEHMFDQGGPAFPAAYDEFVPGRGYYTSHVQGMKLRDYFAAKIMPALMSGEALAGIREAVQKTGLQGFDVTAQTAYAYADAMLKARKA